MSANQELVEILGMICNNLSIMNQSRLGGAAEFKWVISFSDRQCLHFILEKWHTLLLCMSPLLHTVGSLICPWSMQDCQDLASTYKMCIVEALKTIEIGFHELGWEIIIYAPASICTSSMFYTGSDCLFLLNWRAYFWKKAGRLKLNWRRSSRCTL